VTKTGFLRSPFQLPQIGEVCFIASPSCDSREKCMRKICSRLVSLRKADTRTPFESCSRLARLRRNPRAHAFLLLASFIPTAPGKGRRSVQKSSFGVFHPGMRNEQSSTLLVPPVILSDPDLFPRFPTSQDPYSSNRLWNDVILSWGGPRR